MLSFCERHCYERHYITLLNNYYLSILNRGSYMSALVLLNLFNELGKVIKCEARRAFYRLVPTSFIDSIYHMTLTLL